MRYLLLLFLITFPSYAQAQLTSRVCGTRPEITQYLADKHGEKQQGYGVRSPNGLVELWTNESNRTWSLSVTLPSGQMCIVGHGNNWQWLRPKGNEAWLKSKPKQ